jgi:hypothetical protein
MLDFNPKIVQIHPRPAGQAPTKGRCARIVDPRNGAEAGKLERKMSTTGVAHPVFLKRSS